MGGRGLSRPEMGTIVHLQTSKRPSSRPQKQAGSTIAERISINRVTFLQIRPKNQKSVNDRTGDFCA